MTALNVVVETGPLGNIVGQVVVTRAYGEHPSDHPEGPAQNRHVRIWSEEPCARNLQAPDYENTGERLSQSHGDVRVTLVVAQLDIEARFVLLDQVVLE